MLETLNPTPRARAGVPPSLAQAPRPQPHVGGWWPAGSPPLTLAATRGAVVTALPPRAEATAPAPRAAQAAPGAPALETYAAAVFDEVDYPMLLLGPDGGLVHANKLARADLDGDHPLRMDGTQLGARAPADAQALAEALHAARTRGLRRMLQLGRGTERGVSVAVVPLAGPAGGGARAVLLMLAKRQVCESLSAQAFARCHGLTPAETTVLQALCDGEQPQALARALGVAISTVRSQISSIRAKTGAASIRALVRQVAVLPPLVNLLAVPAR